jgi:hypothetical protein
LPRTSQKRRNEPGPSGISTASRSVGALGHVAQPVEIHVRAAIDGNERLAGEVFAGHVLLDARHRQGARGFDDGARVLEDILDRGAHLVGGHQQYLIDVLAGQPQGLLPDPAHRHAVREDAHPVEGHALAGAQRLVHAGRILGFDADDLDLRIQRLGVRGNPRDEAAAAHRHEDRVDLVAVPLAQNFHRDGALAGNHIGVVEGVHEHQAPVAGEDQRVLVRLIVIIAMQHDFAAQVRDRAHLDVGRGHRHHDERGNAPGARGEGDALCVVARGCADDAARGHRRRELCHLVVGAANFERKHRLEVFPLEENAIVQAARQARRRIQRGFDGNVVYFGLENAF